jgi:pimeloyl-ACP methyl ester carboxylesterase
MTHGWPGSVIEFHKVFGPLANPTAHGGSADDAFHIVAPSLPGFGFSDKPAARGWGAERIAAAWAELMRRLGYDRYVAQGGDWGAMVSMTMASAKVPGLIGLHLNMPAAFPDGPVAEDDAEGLAALETMQTYEREESGYALQQRTRPQTLGYALADSPVGQAMWIYEKFERWTDCGGVPETVLSYDEMLDNIMLYWLTNSGASSARLYWESLGAAFPGPLDLPVACSLFPKEIMRPKRSWAQRQYPNMIHWRELDRGGHFAAFEQPELFVQELRDGLRSLR